MQAYDTLLAHINGLRIVDTHEHIPLERDMPRENTDVLAQFLIHYFNRDLISAGLPEAELVAVCDPKQDLMKRWKRIEPFWEAAENTGYGRCLNIVARDLFGIEKISGKTLIELNSRLMEARTRKRYYRWVLQEKSGVAVSIRDSVPTPLADLETDDALVFTLKVDTFLFPMHVSDFKRAGQEVEVEVHSLEDWVEVTRRYIDRLCKKDSPLVCLKLGAAYVRSLRFDKGTRMEAERDFIELFKDNQLPNWRPGTKVGEAFQNYMMHQICGLADERGLTLQVHTGLQEGSGNFVSHSNPTLLTNLCLEYENIKFDLFHMGYPYVMELGNMAKNFRNVFIDMCWGHIISPEAARRALVEWLDAVPANKICAFGGDYCFVEGVYGHQYLARRNVASALAQKVADGSLDLETALKISDWLFVDNPKRIFGLDRFPRYFRVAATRK
jgi:predicted TIM-barrel fold metal-dependent hydrolase